MQYSVHYHVTADQAQYLRSKLIEHNQAQLGEFEEADKFIIEVRSQGALIGGLYGFFPYGWLYIDLLWVEPSYRGQGIGKNLIKKAESIAKDKGINRARLNTASFQQGPSYYQKQGYKTLMQLPLTTNPDINGQTEHTEYFMMKEL